MVAADSLSSKDLVTRTNKTTNEQSTFQISDVLIGDTLVIIGAVGYGVSNVYQEYLVRKFGNIEYLSFATLSAALCTAVYCASLESKFIASLLLQEYNVSSTNSPYLFNRIHLLNDSFFNKFSQHLEQLWDICPVIQ